MMYLYWCITFLSWFVWHRGACIVVNVLYEYVPRALYFVANTLWPEQAIGL